MHAKSSKPAWMFQWDAVDTGPDFGSQNSLKPIKMVFDIIGGRHERNKTERESFLSLDLFSLTFENIFSGPRTGGGGRSPPSTPWIQQFVVWRVVCDGGVRYMTVRLGLVSSSQQQQADKPTISVTHHGASPVRLQGLVSAISVTHQRVAPVRLQGLVSAISVTH